MLVDFLFHLRRSGLKVTTTEFLTLLEVMKSHLPEFSIERFHGLARTCLIKDESLYDRFDRAFSAYLAGVEVTFEGWGESLPEDWLRQQAELYLSDEDREQLAKNAQSWEELLETLRQRLEEQEDRHEGGSKWVGTAGTSPYGAYGDHPQGIRIGQREGRRRSAVKVWDQREFRDLDGSRELGTRNFKIALRRLRRFAREGAATELDLDATIRDTARDGGLLNVRERPERRNVVKLLLFLDVGGSMDPFARVCEELFSAARAEFGQLEYFYFHNCVYERVWRQNRRRQSLSTPLPEVLRTYRSDYRVLFVGDASMSPYELTHIGGSVEHWNEAPGAAYLEQIAEHFPRVAWLNPLPREEWGYTQSVQIVSRLMGERMYPLTLDGLDGAVRSLRGAGGVRPAPQPT